MRAGERGYCDAFAVTDAGVPVDVPQGGIVSEDGAWYVSADFLRRAMHADVAWDEEENTLILRIPEKRMSQSAD